MFFILQRKPSFCLPWLICKGLSLVTCAIAFLVLTIGIGIVLGGIRAGYGVLASLIVLAIGCGSLALGFYIFKIVQSEWMNIKDLDTPKGQF